MTITELIERLRLSLQMHGDREVVAVNFNNNSIRILGTDYTEDDMLAIELDQYIHSPAGSKDTIIELPNASPITVGQFLYASCSNEWYGPITRVGKDANSRDVIDFDLSPPGVNEFIDSAKESLAYFRINGTISLIDVPIIKIRKCEEVIFVELDTPGNGCFRCTKLFSVHAVRQRETT